MPMKTLFCSIMGFIAFCLPASGFALDMVLKAPAAEAAAGQVLPLTILVFNSGEQPAQMTLPAETAVRLQPADPAGTKSVSALAETGAGEITVAAGHFHETLYHLRLPDGLTGPVTLTAVGLPAAPLMISVNPAPAAKPDTAVPANRLDRLADSFFEHEPVYFLVGPDPTHAKFQISFKYRLLNPAGSLARRWQRFENIYFGYTQTSFWDWESDSAPFFDSSYKPELFYYRPYTAQDTVKWISQVNVQTGVLHESNGKSGVDSRSLNMLYLQPGALIETGPRSRFTIEPRFWVYVGDMEDNPDIATYRGYVDLKLAWQMKESWKVAATLRKGTGAGKGSAQVDLTYPLSQLLAGNLNVYLQLQAYTGYAETLLSYDQRYDFIRIGLAVIR